jgi:hypothetical protein
MDNLNNKLSDEAESQPSCLGAVMGSQFWHDAKKELPKRTKGSYSDVDVFVCQMYKYTIGRTFNNKWVNMKNEELTDVVLWAYIPEIPKEMHVLFDCL